MPRKGNIIKIILNAAIFILMEVAALNMLSDSGKMQNFFISKIAHGFQGAFWGTTESIKYYFSLNKANEELSQENFRLTQMLRNYTLEEEMRNLDSLASTMSLTSIGEFRYMPGTIIKISKNKQRNYLIIGQGSEEGVVPQSGIITSNGVIGIVESVSRHYSYALTFMNPEVNVSARLGKEGAIGPLTWDGKRSGGALLKEIPLQYKFQPGDTVFTSGYSSIFPSDIPLGKVTGSRIVNGATYEISVDLFQDPGSVRYVTIVNNVGRDEMEELEKAEEEK
ncbi:MAG: rod shape-determining protein MreC [Bacteroidales bacterium]|jgi:rod shape-determining protein MreC|nr:rod shape-determining protein MreC [Bacteroidales bacterium]MBQ6577659.1 rod shape-determining protein MreC [Bacteroidales bacterium]